MRPLNPIALSLVASAALVGTAAFAQSAEEGRTFVIALTGEAEAPTDGDPDGSGTATITINPSTQEICYTLAVTGIDTPTAAHIHIGDEEMAGPVVVPLAAPTSGTSTGCVTSGRYAAQLWARPERYYVNVHNAEYPGGALRGQLPPRDSD